jgi:hypothetical protein
VAVSLAAGSRGILPEAHGLFARRLRRIGVGVEDCRNVVEDFFKPADPRKPLLDGEIEPAVVGKFALVEQHCSGGSGAFFQTAIAVRLDFGVRERSRPAPFDSTKRRRGTSTRPEIGR